MQNLPQENPSPIQHRNLREQAETLTKNQRRLIAAASDHYTHNIVNTAEASLKEHLPNLTIDFSEIRHNLERRRQQTEKGFTIALFGRTGAGKTTLAAILTQSSQPIIGKGAQRTTRETTEYRWENLTVLDTPGIAAADEEGKEDAEKAFAAADAADLIIFIATEDSPQPAEAHCMAELRCRGKSLLALMNCKQTIAQPTDRTEFLQYPEAVFNDQDLKDRQRQFDELVKPHSANPPPPFIPAHFQSLLIAQQEETENPEQAAALAAASRLQPALQDIQQQAARHSQRAALKTPFDLALPELQILGRHTQEQSHLARQQTAVLKKEIEDLKKWLPEFKAASRQEIKLRIAELLSPLRQEIPKFTEDHAENKNIEALWKSRVERAIKDNKALDRLVDKQVADLNKKAERIERRLAAEIQFNADQANWRAFKKGKIFDTKRFAKWAAGLGGSALGIGIIFLPLGPLGWIAGLAIAAVSWLGSRLGGKSKKAKLQERISQLRQSLNQNLDRLSTQCENRMNQQLDQLTKQFQSNLEQALTEQERKSQNQVQSHAAASQDLQALLQKSHRKLLQETLKLEALDAKILESLQALGRIPGQQTLLMTAPLQNLEASTAPILEAILEEPVQVLPYMEDPEAILRHCLDEPQMNITIDPETRIAVLRTKKDLTYQQKQKLHAAEILTGLYCSREKEQPDHAGS